MVSPEHWQPQHYDTSFSWEDGKHIQHGWDGRVPSQGHVRRKGLRPKKRVQDID